MKKIDERITLHGAPRKALSSLYGHISDESGIRHGMDKNLDLTKNIFLKGVSCIRLEGEKG